MFSELSLELLGAGDKREGGAGLSTSGGTEAPGVIGGLGGAGEDPGPPRAANRANLRLRICNEAKLIVENRARVEIYTHTNAKHHDTNALFCYEIRLAIRTMPRAVYKIRLTSS